MLVLISIITDIVIFIYALLTIVAFYIGMPLHALFFLAFIAFIFLLRSFKKHADVGDDDEEG
jgi:hypothetical protein